MKGRKNRPVEESTAVIMTEDRTSLVSASRIKIGEAGSICLESTMGVVATFPDGSPAAILMGVVIEKLNPKMGMTPTRAALVSVSLYTAPDLTPVIETRVWLVSLGTFEGNFGRSYGSIVGQRRGQWMRGGIEAEQLIS